MTIFITGSTGKTSRRLALQLRGKVPLLIGGRSGNGLEDIPGVKFDWTDASTYDNVFGHPQVQSSPITGVYLVAPGGALDVLPIMQPFIDTLRSKGTRRFVLLSASGMDADTPFLGAVHKYLRDVGVEWTVLRPSWFMQNFTEMSHLPTIRDESKIYTATGDGKLPFVDSEDIAASAAAALTSEKSFDRDFIIAGPESMTYDAAAQIFSDVLSRKIEHIKLSEKERADVFVKQGLSEQYAAVLAHLDAGIAEGKEDLPNNNVEELTGRKPTSLRNFVEQNKQVWVK